MNKKKKSTNTSPYPDEVIDRLARAFYPAILACWNSEEGQRSLVGATPLHLLSQTALPLKSPSGAFIAALRFANAVPPQTLLKTDEEELCQFDTIPPTIEKTERSRRGTPCCTYLCRMWIFQGASGCWVSVKQFSRNDTATALSGLVTSTRLGRGSIKSHVCTVKVLGMGLFAFQERVRLWQGVTH